MNEKIKYRCKGCKRREVIYFENKVILPKPLELEPNSNEFIFTSAEMVDYFDRIIQKALVETKEELESPDHVHRDFVIKWITKITDQINTCGADVMAFTIYLLEYLMKWSWVRQLQEYHQKTHDLIEHQLEFINFIAQGLQTFAHDNNFIVDKDGKIVNE